MTKSNNGTPDSTQAALDTLSGIEELKTEQDKQAVERAIAALDKLLKKVKKRAETAEEFKEKYGRKRFTSSTAGKGVILAFTYWAYLRKEGLSNAELLTQPLYGDINALRAKVKTEKDARLYNRYLQLETWLIESSDATLFMHNSLKSVLVHLHSIVAGALAGEELRNALGAQADKGNVAPWLSLLSVDNLKPTLGSYEAVLTIRQNVESGLQYLKAYNTLIIIIAAEIEIPELVIFQMDMQPVNELITDINKALDLLRGYISKREVVADEEALKTHPPRFTERIMSATLEAFRDVSPDAPPIPEENIRATERYLRDNILHGNKPWKNLLTQLTNNYWWRTQL